MKSKYTALLLILSFSVFQLSCSEDSSSSDEMPPETPEIVGVEPDLSYFENGPALGSTTTENSNFSSANVQATSGLLLLGITQVYNGFFTTASTEEANLNDGVWTWTYTYSFEGQSAEIIINSEERNGRYYWDMSWTYNDGEVSYEDYTILEGSVALDYMDGEWTANDLSADTNTEIPALITQWEILSDTEEAVSVEVLSEGQTEITIDYTKTGVDYLMVINAVDEDEVVIGWNTETGTGFYQQGGTANRMCWDASYTNVTCP